MNEQKKALAVLIIEDMESDAQLVVRLFKKADYELVYEQVESAEQMSAALERRAWDIVISDYKLPQFDGGAALKLLQETGRDIPFIVVSGTIGEETAVAMMKAGAHDYLVKGNLARLVPAVERELEQSRIRRKRAQAEDALKESEEKYRALVQDLPDAIAIYINGKIVFVNNACVELMRAKNAAELLGRSVIEFVHPDSKEFVKNRMLEVMKEGRPLPLEDEKFICFDGSEVNVEVKALPIMFEKKPAVQLIVHDITARKKAEIEIKEQTEDLELINKLNEAVNHSESLDKIIKLFAHELGRISLCKDATIYMLSPDGKSLVMQRLSLSPAILKNVEQLIGMPIPQIQIPIREDGYFQHALQSEHGIITTDPKIIQSWMMEFTETNYLPAATRKAVQKLIPQIYKLLNIRSTMIIPLAADKKVVGLLDVSSAGILTEKDLTRIRNISSQVTSVILHEQANEAVLESEQRYRSLFDRMLDGMYRSTHAGKFVDVNAAMFKMFGYSNREEMLEVDIKKELYFEPDERGSHILDTGQQEVEIYRMRRKDGSEIWVEDHGHYVHDKQGEIVFHEGIMRDVTERVQAEKALAASAAEMRAMIEQAPATVYTESAETQKVLYISPQVEKLTGYTSAEWVEDRDLWKKIIHPADVDAVVAMNNRTRLTHNPFSVEYRILTRDGRTIWIHDEAVIIENQDGAALSWQGVMYDVTERVQAEKARADSDAKLRALVEQVPTTVYTESADTRETLYVSPQVEKLTGYTSAEWIKDRDLWKQMIHPEDLAALLAEDERTNATHEPFNIEYRILTRDGRIRWLRDEAVMIKNQDGTPAFWQGVMYDITERVQAEELTARQSEQLRLLYEASQRLNRTLDLHEIYQTLCDFISNIAANYGFVISAFDPETQLITCRAYWMENKWLDVSSFPSIPLEEEGKGTQSLVIRSGQSMLINDYQAQVKTVQNNYTVNSETNEVNKEIAPDEEITRSALIVPLKIGGRVTGVIQLLSYRLNAYTENQLKLLDALALHVASAEQNALLYTRVQTELNERALVEETLRASEERYHGLFNSMIDGFALHEIICDENGKPVDYRFLEVNPAYERLTGLKAADLIGKTALEVLPNTESYWMDIYGNVALTGRTIFFENYAGELGRYFEVSAYCPKPGQFAAIMVDVSERKRAEQAIHQRVTELETLYQSGLALSQSLEPKAIAQKIIELLEEKLNWHHTRIRLYHPQDDSLELLDFNQPGLNGEIERHEAVKRFQPLIINSSQGISGWVVRHGQPVRSGDLKNDPRYIEANPSIRSGLYIPMKLGERVLGVIGVASEQADAFSEADERLVSTLANQAASAFENARLFNETRQRVTELETLYESGLTLSQSLEPKDIGQRIIELLEEKLNWHHTTIRLYHQNDESMELLSFNQLGLKNETERRTVKEHFQTLIAKSGDGLSGWAVQQSQTIRSGDVRSNPHYIETYPGIRSGLYTPMKLGNRIIGVISIESEQAGAFSEADERLVSTLANQAASSFENARLFNETRQRVAELETLYESGLALSQLLSPKDIGQKILELLEEKLNWHHTRIRLYHQQDDNLELLDFNQPGLKSEMERHEAVERFQPLITNSSQGISGWVIRHGKPVRSGDVSGDPRYVEAYPGIRSGLYVPMKLGEHILGVIGIESEQAGAFSEADERLIGTLANQAASAFENARLFEVTRKRAQELETLNRIALVLRVESKQAEMLKIILDEALAILNARDGSIELWDEAGGYLQKTILRGWFDKIIEPPQNSDEGIVGNVFSSGEMYITREFASDPKTRAESRSQTPPGWGGICLPIRTTHKTLGVLIVSVPSAYEITRDETRLLSILAEMTGAALQRIQLHEETARRAEELIALQAMALDISSPNPLSELLYLIVERAANLIGASGGGLYLTEPEHRRVRCVVSYKTKQDFTDTLLDYGVGAAGYVAETGESIIIDDYRDWSNRAGVYEDKQPFQAVMSAPMIWQGNVSGVIHLLRDDSLRNFTQEELNLLMLFANHAAVAVENARLLDSTQQHVSELTVLHRIGQTLLAARLDPELIYAAVHKAVEQVMPCEAFVIVLDDEDGGDYHAVYFFDKGERFAPKRLQRGTGLSGHVISSNESLLVDDLRNENDLPMHHFGSQEKVRSILAVPLRKGSEIIGMLSTQSYQAHAFSAAQCLLLETISAQLATAIDNATLYQQTQTRLKELQALYNVSVSLRTAQTLEEVLPILLDETLSALETDAGSIMLYHPASGELRDYLSRGWLKELESISIKVGEGAAGTVFASGQPYCADEFIRDPLPNPISKSKIPAGWGGACLPIRAGSESVGVFFVSVRLPRQINSGQMKLLDSLAEIAGATLHRMRLYEETAHRAEEFASLYETSKIFSAENELDSLLETIVEHARTLLGSESSGIYLYDQASGDVEVMIDTAHHLPIGTRLKLGEGMAGLVAQTRQPLRVKNYSTWEGRSLRYDSSLTRAVLEAPMLYGGELIGVLITNEMGNSERVFTEADERLLTLFASQAAGAIHSARLHEETARRAEEFASLYETSKILSAENELNSLLQSIVEHAQALLHSGSSGIYLYNPACDELEVVVDTNPEPYAVIGMRLKLGEGTAGHVAQTRQPMRIDDYSVWEGRSTQYAEIPFHAVLEVPMLYGGELIGVLAADETGDSMRKFTEADERLLTLFASQAAGAIRSARLHKETVHRLERLQALRVVDQAISSSLDMHMTLNILLTHTLTQLNVDAADVLLFHSDSNMLELMAGRGFYTLLLESVNFRDSLAGRAIMEYRTITVSDLEIDALGENKQFEKFWKEEKFSACWCVPLIVKGEARGALEVYRRTASAPDSEWIEFLETLAGQAAITIDNTQLFDNLQRANMDLILAYNATIEGWSRAMEMRDNETQGHTQRVADLTMTIAKAMGLPSQEMIHIRRGALLHDIGKMGIPDEILLKRDALTDEEWVIMRKHPQLARDMLISIAYLRDALVIPYCHHENWDGTGYPQGLKGSQIPLAARLFAVVDVWDALTSNRSYRKKWTKKKTLAYIQEQRGKRFDPQVVDVFLKIVK